MPLLILSMLVFFLLGMLWIIGAGLLFGTVAAGTGRALDKVLDYKGSKCACRFPFRGHT